MPAFIDRTGHRYGRLTVVRRAENSKHRHTRWECLCDCGTTTVVDSPSLATGNSTSCGCLFTEQLLERNTKHGRAGSPSEGSTYSVWMSMRGRCNNHRHVSYPYYGGRGIKVCPRWDCFEAFLEDMGERPEGMSIERLDVNGDYCPENCVWIPLIEQNKNTRRNVQVTYKGRAMIALDFAREIGRKPGLVYRWLKQGLTPEQIAAKPKPRPKELT